MPKEARLYTFETFSVKTVRRKRRQAGAVPLPRSGHRVAASEKYLFVFGGFNPDVEVYNNVENDSGPLFKQIWRFNLTSYRWRLMPFIPSDMPSELASMCLAKAGNYLLAHGGTGIPFGHNNSNKIYACNMVDYSVSLLQVSEKPPPGYGQGAALDESTLNWYVLGGTSGQRFSMDVWRFSIAEQKWKLLGEKSEILGQRRRNAPPARYRHEVALHDNKIYVFGGGTVDETFNFQELPVFDLATEQWEKVDTFGALVGKNSAPRWPGARRCHSGVLVPSEKGSDPYFVIAGGMDGTYTFKDIWSFNLVTRQWSCYFKRLPFFTYFHDAALSPTGRMILFGGIISTSKEVPREGARTNKVFSCWVKIPKLSEIAWEAVRFFCKDLTNEPAEKLLKLGIPTSFIDRLKDED